MLKIKKIPASYSNVSRRSRTIQTNIQRTFTTRSSFNMPLVVPGINSNDGSKTEEWMNKLVGKKIGETSDSTVCSHGTCIFIFFMLTIADLRKERSPRGA